MTLGIPSSPAELGAVTMTDLIPGASRWRESPALSRHTPVFSRFERTWARSGHWGIVVSDPATPPVGVTTLNYLQAARALEDRGNVGPARIAYTTATRRWPDSALARLVRGNTFFESADYSAAEKDYRLATSVNPTFVPGWINLSHALIEQDCYQAARQAARCAALIEPGNEAIVQAIREIDAATQPESGQCSIVLCDH